MVDELHIDQSAYHRMMRDNAHTILNRYGDQITRAARSFAPRRTGALQSSIRASTSTYRGMPVVTVGSNLPYAAYVHEGTGVYGPRHRMIRPRSGRFLVWREGSQLIFARKVRGIRATKFLTKAIDRVFGGR